MLQLVGGTGGSIDPSITAVPMASDDGSSGGDAGGDAGGDDGGE